MAPLDPPSELAPQLFTDFQPVDSIYFPLESPPQYVESKQLWEGAAEGWIRTGYGEHAPGGIWKRFPPKAHFGTIADLGCGYGRHSIFLSQQLGITCDRYYAFDIAEGMLRRLWDCKKQVDFFSQAEFIVICMPLTRLPIPDNSVDLVYSSSVFMHLKQDDITHVLGEVQRILKPGGNFIFNDSFHHQNCPSYRISNWFRRFTTPEYKTMYLRQYTLDQVQKMIDDSQISHKAGSFTIAPSNYEVLPPKIQRWVPGAKWVNDRLIRTASPQQKKEIYASSYGVYSQNLFKS